MTMNLDELMARLNDGRLQKAWHHVTEQVLKNGGKAEAFSDCSPQDMEFVLKCCLILAIERITLSEKPYDTLMNEQGEKMLNLVRSFLNPPLEELGVLLPVHETFYGDIHPDDLSRFLACAGEALRGFGFSRIKVLNPDKDSEKELWGIGELTTEGMPPRVITTDGEDVDLQINWLDMIDSDTDEILRNLREATGEGFIASPDLN